MCLDNINQDSILLIRAGDSLLINLNDSPLCGESGFIKDIVRRHENDKVYAFAICAVAADMMNIVDANEERITPPPQDYYFGAIGSVAKTVEHLGARYFCCSSSQHIYVRKDTQWLNDYDISYEIIKQYWSSDRVELVPPFVTYDLADSSYSLNWPTFEMDESQMLGNTGDDDWDEAMEILKNSPFDKAKLDKLDYAFNHKGCALNDPKIPWKYAMKNGTRVTSSKELREVTGEYYL